MRSFEQTRYATKWSGMIGRLGKETLVPTESLLSYCCVTDHLSDEWLASNDEY